MSKQNPKQKLPTDSPSAEHLLARQEDFVRLYAQHEPMVHGFVLSLVPAWDDAAEILQETSLVLWRKFAEFEPGTNFLRWACRIAEFEVRRFRTRKQRSRLQFSEELLDQIAVARLDATDAISDRRRALHDCMARLKDPERTLLVARYIEQRAAREMAESLGQPVNTIYKSLQRIRAALYECINRRLAQEDHP